MLKTDTALPPPCEFANVSKWYGDVIGVNDLTMELQPGITGLVGPNGAGKTTTIRLLTGQLRPSIGEVRIRGLSSWSAEAKSHVGYCADVDAFYEEMSGRRFVYTMARLHGLNGQAAKNRTEEVLAQVDMTRRAGRKLAGYSKGMRQRIKLAQALVHEPDIIVLDEPLNGVDPVGRRELVHLFRQLAESGKALLVSSHILEDMDSLADRILFICRGRLLASGTLEQIRDTLDDYPLHIRITSDNLRRLARELVSCDCVLGLQIKSSDDLIVEVEHPKQFYRRFAAIIAEGEYEVQRLQVLDASTEAIFDYLMERRMV